MKNLTLITGSAKGFGAHLALTLAKKGYSLIIHYHTNDEAANKLKTECLKYTDYVEVFSCNFLLIDEIYLFYEKIKNFPVKNLINNVGNYLIKPISETEVTEWIELFQTNLHAPFILTRLLLDSIIQQQGAIINLGVAGLNSFRADTYSSAYTITKEALLSFTKSLAKELIEKKVTVNMVSPGYMENSIDLNTITSKTPIIPFKDVSALILHLLSFESKKITGQNIEISGGVRL